MSTIKKRTKIHVITFDFHSEMIKQIQYSIQRVDNSLYSFMLCHTENNLSNNFLKNCILGPGKYTQRFL